jgi:uncharacterized membrane protein
VTLLILGLVLFFATHAIRLSGEGPRAALVATLGPLSYKGLYAMVSLIGLLLIIKGYGEARLTASVLWSAPVWLRHLVALLTLVAFLFLFATYLPANHFKSLAGHPMLAGVKLWALAHLLVNGSVADLLLFGSFLAWSVALYAVLRRRDRAAGRTPATATWAGTVATVVVGGALWAGFALHGHLALIGVAPFAT